MRPAHILGAAPARARLAASVRRPRSAWFAASVGRRSRSRPARRFGGAPLPPAPGSPPCAALSLRPVRRFRAALSLTLGSPHSACGAALAPLGSPHSAFGGALAHARFAALCFWRRFRPRPVRRLVRRSRLRPARRFPLSGGALAHARLAASVGRRSRSRSVRRSRSRPARRTLLAAPLPPAPGSPPCAALLPAPGSPPSVSAALFAPPSSQSC